MKLRVVMPSNLFSGTRWFARIGRWQPKQLVAHDEWQTWQVMFDSWCAKSCAHFDASGTSPQV